MTSILDASALISLIPTLLPSSKSIETPQDALALLSHAILTSVAFRLIAVDDSSSTIQSSANTLPDEWNKHGPGSYTLRYRHEQSSMEFVVKISKLGSRTMFNAIAVENDKATSLDISTNDFTSPSSFPYSAEAPAAPPLVHCYISSNRVTDFVSQFKLKIIQKLVPGLRKDGYTEEVDVTTTNPPNFEQGSATVRTPPTIPRYNPDDEFPLRMPSRNPLEIGRRDRDPAPGGSFQPPPLFSPSGGDGMFVGPDHPIFGRRGPGGLGGIGGMPGRGPWGGDGYLPPMGAPPGARFDPVGPGFGTGGIGPFHGNLGPRRPNLPGEGDPDNDEFMPPGASDMYM
ncbi:PI31 proteasome regulator N-terminal-domain-containing protein [Rhodocollybia butyracea]|uniref:PI31 proteasome regulator N-terminal-domain-containing protein n=1 Tax=Rhodocollybia butyracea TaxID=206335 RepID=A0A9P5Q0P0_9AGAR|nr:PI31 proteasome regulator N-terminal-domain-containing protein [Rhodocollybia butyracea]